MESNYGKKQLMEHIEKVAKDNPKLALKLYEENFDNLGFGWAIEFIYKMIKHPNKDIQDRAKEIQSTRFKHSAELITQLFTPTLESLNFLQNIPSFKNDLAIQLAGIQQSLTNFQQQILPTLDSLIKFGEISDKFKAIMLELNWPPPLDIDPQKVAEFVEKKEKSGLEDIRKEINEYLINFYNDEILKDKLKIWKSKNWLKRRLQILSSVIEAHNKGNYILSIPTMLPQIEGIIAEGYGHRGRFNSNHMQTYMNNLLRSSQNNDFNSLTESFIVNTLLVTFEYGTPIRSSLSRHAILHGADVDYGTPENSLKSILLFDYLQDAFRLIGLDTSEKYHLIGCKMISKSNANRTAYKSHDEAKSDGRIPCKICLKKWVI